MTESVERPAEPAMRILADDVLAWVQPDGSWWINNAGAIITSGGVILIDTCATERRTRALLGALDRATGGTRVTYAVNTHQHGDHAYGNSLLPESTVIIGHEATRAALLADPVIDGCPPFWEPVPDWGNVTRRPPTLTTSTSIVLHHGNCRVELLHPGYPAHTAGDLVAWLPAQRILFTGDLLFGFHVQLLPWLAGQLGFDGDMVLFTFQGGLFTIPVTSYLMGLVVYLRIIFVVAILYQWWRRPDLDP